MLGVTHSVHCGIAFLDDSALRTAAAIMAHLHTVFRITVGALLTPALTISSTGALGHFFLVIPALRAARAAGVTVVHFCEILILTWGTFTLTMVPLAWINEVSAYEERKKKCLRAQQKPYPLMSLVARPPTLTTPGLLTTLELSSWIPSHSLHT